MSHLPVVDEYSSRRLRIVSESCYSRYGIVFASFSCVAIHKLYFFICYTLPKTNMHLCINKTQPVLPVRYRLDPKHNTIVHLATQVALSPPSLLPPPHPPPFLPLEENPTTSLPSQPTPSPFSNPLGGPNMRGVAGGFDPVP